MNKSMTGVFLRGLLVGTKSTTNKYTDKATREVKTTLFTEIGIEVEFVNGFGQCQKMTKSARISADKQNDSAFMKSLIDNHLKIVELPVNLGDYRNVYVDRDAVLVVLGS